MKTEEIREAQEISCTSLEPNPIREVREAGSPKFGDPVLSSTDFIWSGLGVLLDQTAIFTWVEPNASIKGLKASFWRNIWKTTDQDRFCYSFVVADRFNWINYKLDVWLKQALF